MRDLVLLTGASLALACCAEDAGPVADTRAAAAPAAAEPIAPQREAVAPATPQGAGTPTPSEAEQSHQSEAASQARNDPSAPLDTPLCGRAARERVAIDAALEPNVIPGAGACAQTACFDPATDTFIGADGYRHVCQ